MTGQPAATHRAPRRVLLVCAGNICRSPAAAAVLRRLAADRAVDLEVRSRGTHDWNVGRPAHPAMARIAAGRGYDLSGHVAAQVSPADLAWADEVLVTDEENLRRLRERHPGLAGHARLLADGGIPDPWLVDRDPAYADALDRIELAVRAYLAGQPPDPA